MLPLRIVSLSLVFLAGTSIATAQKPHPVPKLFHALPAGGQSGTKVEVSIAGTDLDSADSLWFSDLGVTAVPISGKAKTFQVSIGPQVPSGSLDIRALTPDGVSNPRTFVVGSRPESNEVEPNNDLPSSKPITINSVVNGNLGPVDVDCFWFEGKKDQRISVQVAAASIESKLDATLRLFDARGVELAESRDAFGTDPSLEVTLPANGRYYIKIHDVTYTGSPEHFYRMSIDDGPRIDAIFPAIAARGQTSKFSLIGQNFDGIAPSRPFPEFKEETLSPTFQSATELPFNYPGSSSVLRGYVVRKGGNGGLSNPIVMAEADGPIITEHEPNTLETPQAITPPCSIGGDFRIAGDIDTYRFQAKKGEIWRIEAIAEGIGSAADPTFTIQRVPEKGEPADLVTADDTPDPGLSPRFNLASIDATLRWTVPSDGIYQIVLNDVAGSSRGDPRLFYRLSIRRERPGFRLFLVPSTPNALDSVTLRKGGRSSAVVLAWRFDGYTGPIWVVPNGLPAGVECAPVVIPTGQVATNVVFQATADAKPTAGVIKLMGLGSMSAITRPKNSAAIEAWSGFELRNEAIPGSAVWPPVKLPNSQKTPVAVVRATRGFVVAIREGSPFLLTTHPKRDVVVPGQTLDLEVSVQRSAGFDEPITFTATDLPAGFVAPLGNLAKGVSSTKVAWVVPKTVATGIYSLLIRGSSTFKSDPKSSAFKVDEPSNPFVVTVVPAPLTLSTTTKPTMKPGQSIDLEVKIDRQEKFVGPASLTLEAPSGSKLRADPLTIPAGQSIAKIVLHASAESPVGSVATILRSESVVGGETIEIALPLVVSILKP